MRIPISWVLSATLYETTENKPIDASSSAAPARIDRIDAAERVIENAMLDSSTSVDGEKTARVESALSTAARTAGTIDSGCPRVRTCSVTNGDGCCSSE